MILEVNDVEVMFEGSGFTLHPISFSMEEGKIVSIVGESGSGKSTSVRKMQGLAVR